MNKNHTESVIAYINFLSFTNLNKNSKENDNYFQNTSEVISALKEVENNKYWDLRWVSIEESAQKKGENTFDISKQVCCSLFPNSLVVSVKIVDDNFSEIISNLISHLAYIGHRLLLKGIMIRGGITYGNLIHNKELLSGDGLTDASFLENSFAIYPRVILSKKLVEKLDYPIKSKRDDYPYNQYVQQFDDEFIGFHQMVYYQVHQSNIEIKKEDITTDLIRTKQIINEGLVQTRDNIETHSYFKWLKNHYESLTILY